jgi:UDP-N-acetylglucosamine acyltransferase
MSNIHPMAVVEEGAKIGEGVIIEPFAVVKSNVTLADGVTIKSHAYIDGHTTIGANTIIYPGASIGTKTQDLKFEGEVTYVEIGSDCEIREFCTINSSCGEGSKVTVGNSCMIMAYCHIGHSCSVGDRVILTNSVQLAGHVTVEHDAIVGGLTGVHQFVRIGCHAMVGGMARVISDVPPYTIGGNSPYKMGGINVIGLKRRNFDLATRTALSKCYKLVYRSGLPLDEAIEQIKERIEQLPEVEHFVNFCATSERGLIGLNEER